MPESEPKNPLLKACRVGAWNLPHRVVMAPLTRSRAAMPGNVPHALNAAYYAQRAAGRGGASLIISEATPISPRAHGYYATPGIHTDAQVRGWRLVTEAVHAAGGLIVCQLWHVGRVSHVALQPGGEPPVGPTDVASQSKTYVDASVARVQTSQPRALRTEEVAGIAREFAEAAGRAMDAGFDGVEIHGANTYILDQFTRDGMNLRTDEWGGTLENRLRLPLLAAEGVVRACGADRVGYRISPLSDHHDARDSDPGATFAALASGLGALGIAYIHAVETWDRATLDPRTPDVIPRVRDAFKAAHPHPERAAYIANGDYSPALAASAIADGWCDAVAFGRALISNPDMAVRIGAGAALTPWDRETFYGGGAEGYTDYPAMDAG